MENTIAKIVLTFRQEVDYDVPLDKLIDAGGYKKVVGGINPRQIPRVGHGKGLVEFHCLDLCRGEWFGEEAYHGSEALGLHLATVHEILTVAANQPNKLPSSGGLHSFDRTAYKEFQQIYYAGVLINPYGGEEKWLIMALNPYLMTSGTGHLVLATSKKNLPTE